MPINSQELAPLDQESVQAKPNLPTLIKWKNEPMIRVHSLRASVKEIVNTQKALDVVKVGVVGEESTGKTTLMESISHLIHKTSEVPYAVRNFGEDELLHFKDTLAGLDPANYVLKFDDVSFINNRKAIEELKNAVTKIRHLPGGQDVLIIIIYGYHYTLGLDKYLRQANFRYFTSVGSSEGENMEKIVGTKYRQRIMDFQRIFVEQTTKHKATYQIGPKKYFVYPYKQPFVSCLFWNNQRLRNVVFPKREWIDKICAVCTVGKGIQSEISLDDFVTEGRRLLGERVFDTAVKLKLFQNGMNTYSPTISRACKWLDKALERKIISLDDVAAHLELKISKTRLRKGFEGVMA